MGDRPRGDTMMMEKGYTRRCIIRLERAQLTRRRHNYPQPIGAQICAQAKKFQEDKRTNSDCETGRMKFGSSGFELRIPIK